MSTGGEPDPPDAADDRLGTLADEFTARLRRGERPRVADYVAANPDLATELHDLLPPIAALEQLKTHHLVSTGRIGFLGLPTDRLGDFRIVREIGRGGMGIVYEAQQESLGRRVALKTLPHAALLSPRQLERFQREAETASQLQHPNIVPIHAVGADAGVHYFAMPRIDGASLDRAIAALRGDEPATGDPVDGTDAPLVAGVRDWIAAPQQPRAESWRRIAHLGAEVADALEFAHRHGVLHRDVKPSNILVEPNGKVWVTDFGIAKIHGEDGMTRTGEFLGTLQYAPPEQLDGSGDARGDVYGLGLVLFELAARRPAFAGNSRRDLADRIRNGLARTLRQVDRSAPRDLETILAKATAFEPNHRYGSAAALADDLRRFAAGRPIAARDVFAVERVWRWSQRNPATATLAASTVLGIVAAATIGWSGYLTTSEALQRERLITIAASQNLQQAKAATARAETNLSLSLRSLNELFDAIAEDRQHGTADEPLLDMTSSPSLSHKELDLLRRTVAFYEQFAAENADASGLRLDTARALRRIGDLNHWTGAVDDAAAAYQRAADYYDQLAANSDDPDLAVEQASIERCLGAIDFDCGRGMAGVRHFESARSTLAAEVRDRPSDRNRRELVCVLNTIAAAMSRPTLAPQQAGAFHPMLAGGYVQAAAACRQALLAAETLVAAHPGSPPDLLLLARCHRLNAQVLALAPGRNRSAGAIERSMQVLTRLSEASSDHAGYRYELAEATCLLGAVGEDDPAVGLRRCRDGVQMARDLVTANPAVPIYQDLLGRCLRRLADTLARGSDTAAAMTVQLEAIELRSQLVQRFPAAPNHTWELAVARQSLADLALQRGDAATARSQLEAAVDEVRHFGGGSDRFLLTFALLPGLHAQLRSVLERLGDTDAIARLDAQWPGGEFPPGPPSRFFGPRFRSRPR